jgi:hypothetical protein
MNISKGGISFTVGKSGAHLNFSKRGVRQTVGIPGTGVSESSYLIKNDVKDDTESETKKPTHRKKTSSKKTSHSVKDSVADEVLENDEEVPVRRRRSSPWMLLLGVVVVYLGALVLQLIPTNFLSHWLLTITHWIRGLGL